MLVGGCKSGVDVQRVEPISGADALWSGGGDFCARTPSGLVCWGTHQERLVDKLPAPIEGLTGVTDVAMVIGQTCVLAEGGVSCFSVGPKPTLARKALDLWSGERDDFFTRQGEALHQRGWDSGKRVDRLVRGMKRPCQVVPGLYWTCVLDDVGAVGCIKNKRR